MKRVWKKIGIAALGMVLCFGTSFLAMVPASRSTEAAVAVFDQKNIEEAIKTAIRQNSIRSFEHWSNNLSPEDLGSLIFTVMH